MPTPLAFCSARLPEWGLRCWNAPGHKGIHRGHNTATGRIGTWGPGAPTHVKRMSDPGASAAMFPPPMADDPGVEGTVANGADVAATPHR